MSTEKLFAFGTLFFLVLSLNVGQAQLIPLFDWVISFFGNYEEPPYMLMGNVTDNIEERMYPAKKWICTEQFLPQGTKENKRSEMFMRLQKYIQGENDADQKLEMTIPVMTKIDHRNGDLYSYEMCFFIPDEFQKSPPRPLSRIVRVVAFPELHVFSQRFGGYSTQEVEQEQLLSLAITLRNNSVPYFEEKDGPSRAIHFINGYDSPTKFWNRRNEVWLLGMDNKPLPVNHHLQDKQQDE